MNTIRKVKMKIYLQVNLINVPGGKTVRRQLIEEYEAQLRGNFSAPWNTTVKSLVFHEYKGQACSGKVEVTLRRLPEGETAGADCIDIIEGITLEDVEAIMVSRERELVENEIPFRVTAKLEPVELRLAGNRQWFGIVAYRDR